MNKCDLAQDAAAKVRAANIEEAEANDQAIEQDFSLEAEPKIDNTILRKLASIGDMQMTEEEFNEHYGTNEQRKLLADKLWLIMKGHPHLAPTMQEEFKFRIANVGAEMPKDIIMTDEFGQKHIVFDKLPIKTLRGFYKFAEQWTQANGANWDNLYYKNIRIPFGLGKKLRFEENTGAYNKVFLATQRYADAQGGHIHRFMSAESLKPGFRKAERYGKQVTVPLRLKGMTDIIDDVESIFYDLTEEEQATWLEPGFWKNRSMAKGQANLIELFSWMMRGRVKYISQDMIDKAKDKTIYKHGEGVYIATQWAPTGHGYKSTGDAVFAWQKPVPLKYDAEIHGDEKNMKLVDYRGEPRYDTLKLIRNSVPLSKSMFDKLESLVQDARIIDNDFFFYSKDHMQSSFDNILGALKTHFPKKTASELKKAFTDYEFKNKEGENIWSKEEMAKFNMLEEQFTAHSLSAPFLNEGISLEHKDNHYPYLFMPEMYMVLLGESIDNISGEIESLNISLKESEGAERLAIGDKIDGLESSLRHMKEMKESRLFAPDDNQLSTKMITRQSSKYFKHISNAFDMLKARSDKNVYQNFLEHTALSVERNNLTAELIRALDMTDQGPVKEAMIELYKRTIGRTDTRSNLFGLDISDENMPDKVVRGLRALRKYYTLMLAGPATAVRNYMGHIEKLNKVGLAKTWESFKYYGQWKEDDRLKSIVRDSGVIVFEEFFTHSIVKDLEEMAVQRDEVGAVVHAFLQYHKDLSNNVKDNVAERKLQKALKIHLGKSMKYGAIMTEEEAKAMNQKMKEQRLDRMVSKIVNYSIMNQYQMRESIKHMPLKMLKPSWWVGNIAEKLGAVRNVVKQFAVMSEAEKHLRITSFILGVQGAQKVGLIGPGRIHELEGADRTEAIKYGRQATTMMFDFGMSKQHVGEIHSSAVGQLGSEFAVWRTQKASSDLDLFKNAAKVFDTDSTPLAILKALGTAINPIKYPAKLLQKTNHDALMLRRFLKGQFLIEGVMQMAFLGTSLLPAGYRQILRMTGARKAAAAGSDLAAWFWMPVILAIRAATDNLDDDEEEIERNISYMLRKIPVAGVGVGLLYDMTALLMALLNEEDEILENKVVQGLNYIAPMPYTYPIKKEIVKRAMK